MSNSVDSKLRFLRHRFHFKKTELGEIRNYYSGAFFNPKDPAFCRLLELSHSLCERYRILSEEIPCPCSLLRRAAFFAKRRRILTSLFPHAPLALLAGPGLEVVIGSVDVESISYLNNDVVFHPNCLVALGNRIRFGPNVEVGDEAWEKQGSLVRAKTIRFGDDCWIGYGSKIAPDVILSSGTILAAGAFLQSSTRPNALMVSRPAYEKTIVDETYLSHPKTITPYTAKEKKILLKTLTVLGLRRSWFAYERYLSGASVNIIAPSLAKVFVVSHKLCREYSSATTTPERQNEIKHLLFPLQGEGFRLEKGFWLDILGATRVGSHVHIGKDAYLSGNLIFGDDVSLGDEVSMFASGHPMVSKNRRFFFSLKKGFHEEGQLYSITLMPNIHVGDRAVIAPSLTVTQDVPNDGLYTHHGLVK